MTTPFDPQLEQLTNADLIAMLRELLVQGLVPELENQKLREEIERLRGQRPIRRIYHSPPHEIRKRISQLVNQSRNLGLHSASNDSCVSSSTTECVNRFETL
jgi:hypothetical protein